MKKRFLSNTLFSFVLLFVSCQCMIAQQRVQFTQYMFNELVINPAYAGGDNAPSFTFVNRSQWSSIDGAPKTQTLTAQTYLKKKKVGTGVTFVNDQIGVHKNQNIFGSVSYRLPVYYDQAYFSFGLQAGADVHRSDYQSLMSGVGGVDPNTNVSYTAFNVGVGMYFKTPVFELGLSAPQLIPEHHKYNDSVRINWSNAQYFGFLRYTMRLSKSFDLQPSVLLKYMQGVPLSYDINAGLVFKKLVTMALSYRKKESVDFLIKAKLTPQLQFGYSYDYAIGEVSRNSGGSNELMVNYLIKPAKNKFVSPR